MQVRGVVVRFKMQKEDAKKKFHSPTVAHSRAQMETRSLFCRLMKDLFRTLIHSTVVVQLQCHQSPVSLERFTQHGAPGASDAIGIQYQHSQSLVDDQPFA
uniref:Uncharacterized protein n=1 Tax=Palpitomonas bilix TaxID=652834 RepID=A0A7S3LXD9_9EUKA